VLAVGPGKSRCGLLARIVERVLTARHGERIRAEGDERKAEINRNPGGRPSAESRGRALGRMRHPVSLDPVDRFEILRVFDAR